MLLGQSATVTPAVRRGSQIVGLRRYFRRRVRSPDWAAARLKRPLGNPKGSRSDCLRQWPKILWPVFYSSKAAFTRYNRLSNPLSNPLTTGCIVYTNIQPFDSRFDKRLYRVYSRLSNRVCQTGCHKPFDNRSHNGWMFVYTIQPVVKPVMQPVWQPVASCKRGLT